VARDAFGAWLALARGPRPKHTANPVVLRPLLSFCAVNVIIGGRVSPIRSRNRNELDALGGVDDREVSGIVIALEMKRLLGDVDMRHLPRV
jgi:hypothetical protein